MLIRSMRWAYVVTVWIILAAVVVQVFLAGLGLFVSANLFAVHAMFGTLLGLVMLLGLGLAFAARLPRGMIGLTALLPGLVILQIVFIEVGRTSLHPVQALHVVNALAIFWVTIIVAQRARRFIPAHDTAPSATRAETLAASSDRAERPFLAALRSSPRRGG
ncbi:MAG TPA: DUF6220 domain-containing protein [Ktedonobacterales bacterium]|nr:DUF6220 domain-containing protein [Ktedonobacterales bacterium]